MADNKVYFKINHESYEDALEQLQKLNKEIYLISKLFKRSWLLRLIFGVNLKELDMEVTYK